MCFVYTDKKTLFKFQKSFSNFKDLVHLGRSVAKMKTHGRLDSWTMIANRSEFKKKINYSITESIIIWKILIDQKLSQNLNWSRLEKINWLTVMANTKNNYNSFLCLKNYLLGWSHLES